MMMHCDRPMLPILWGYPGHDAYEAQKRGELVIGGSCMVGPENPDWQCPVCGFQDYGTLEERG